MSRKWLHVAASLAFMMALLGAAGPASAAGVDLAVVSPDITFSSTSPVDGQMITIQVLVRNFGDTNATDVTVVATETGTATLVGEASIASVPAQGQAQAGISWNVSGVGTKSVTISVSSAEVDANPENNQAVSTTVTVRARPDLAVSSVTFDNPTPPAFSTSVEIRVQVSNVGGSNATSVVLALYDGDPNAGGPEIYRATLSLVPTGSPVQTTYTWNIANKGGRHDIYAQVLASTPSEYATTMDNNIAFGTLLVLTQYDIEVTGAREIAYNPQLNGFLIVRSGGDLTLRNCVLTLLQERDNQFDVIVEDGGRLTMVNAAIVSEHAFGLTLRAGGQFRMSEGSEFGGTITSDGGTLAADDSVVQGGLVGSYADLSLHVVAVRGDVSLEDTTATWDEVALEGAGPVRLKDSTVEATNLSIPQAVPNGIEATGATVGQFFGLVSGPLSAAPGSTLSVYRLVSVHVADFTGIPIRNATVHVSWALSLDPAGTVSTGGDGSTSLWLLTDLLAGAAPQYVGSYLFDASYTTYTARAAANLPFYPTLTAESNQIAVSVVFPVINPADLFPAIDGDKTVGAGQVWNVGSYMQDGNLRIAGIVNVAGGTFTLSQDRDFEKAIILTGGTFNLSGTQLVSNHRYNIYLFGSSKLVATGSTLNANALVLFDSSTASISDGSAVNANLILPGGSSLTIGAGTEVRSDLLWARGGPSIIARGALLAVRTIDIATTADISLNNSEVQFTGAALIHSAGTTSTLSINNSRLVGSTADLEAGRIDVAGTEFAVGAVTRLWAGTVQMASTTVTGPIGGIKPGSAVAFYDVVYPSIVVDATAVVNIFQTLTFSVLDINGNAVTAGSFAIRAMPNGTTDLVSGSLAPVVSRSLHGATIRGGVEVFDGNYRLTIALDGADDEVRYVVMDAPQTLIYALPDEIVPPTNVDINAVVEPTVLASGDDLWINGTVSLRYAGRAGSLLPRGSVALSISANGVKVGEVSTLPDGSFNWTGNLSVLENTTGTVVITISGTYQDVDGARALTVDLLVPPPTTIFITLDNVHFTKRQNEDFVISGVVRYGNDQPAGGVKIRVYFTIPPQAQEYFATSDDSGLWSVTIPGRRTSSTYSIGVLATDERYGLASVPQGVTVDVIGVEGGGGGDLGELAWVALLIAIAAIAGVGGFVVWNARRSSVNYVECGNCGKPVHEGESKCPSCGVEFEEDIAKCSHCNSWIPANESRCPKCNTEFKPVDEIVSAAGETPAAPDAKEEVRAEVTTTPEPVRAVKQPVAVKKKVLKRAVEPGKEGADETPDPFADADGAKADDQAGERPSESKDGEKKEKGLFDDL